MNDLRFALRQLVKNPAFTLIAGLTLALGIGANTAIFSVVDAVLLRALPYHNSNRLIVLSGTEPGGTRDGLSIPELQDFQKQMPSLEDLAGFQSQSVNLTGGERPDRVRGAFVSANFFKVFNLPAVVGRTFADGEDNVGAEKYAVINEKLWRERLNGDPNLETKKLILNGEPYSVIGVISSSFKNPFDPNVEVWMSMANYPGNTNRREARFMMPMGHLKSGVRLAQAQAEASLIANQFAQAYPKENSGRGAKTDYLRNATIGNARSMLWLLFAAVGVILLMACANVANLLLARGLTRQREMALRAALGASRWQLIRQLLTESTVLGLLGGGAGVLLAQWALYGLTKLPTFFIQTEGAIIDTRVLLFALAASLVTAWVFGLVPALQLANPALHSTLKEGSAGSGESARWNRIRGGFVIGQVALSILLLVSAGLLIKSFDKLLRVNVGFNPENLLTLEYRLPRAKYREPEPQWNFHRQTLQQIQQLPGVKSVALIRSLAFTGNGASAAIALLDREAPPAGREPQASFNTATSNYFETIGIPLIEGRLFGEQDQLNTPRVFLINRTMAKRFWPDHDPIGKQIKLLEDGATGTVIGVVGDAKHYWLDEEAAPQMYAAYSQQPGVFATVVVRTSVEPMSLAESVRHAIWKVDPDQPMWKIRTVDSLIDRSTADKQFLVALMGTLAALALVLTMIGLYGVISYLVNHRTREIGIRIALGAQVRHILKMVLNHGMRMVLIGIGVGLAAAWMLTRVMARLLYGVSTTDPLTFLTVASMLAIVALVACYIPARRATLVDPIEALRTE